MGRPAGEHRVHHIKLRHDLDVVRGGKLREGSPAGMKSRACDVMKGTWVKSWKFSSSATKMKSWKFPERPSGIYGRAIPK
jgi:hypothetical protein